MSAARKANANDWRRWAILLYLAESKTWRSTSTIRHQLVHRGWAVFPSDTDRSQQTRYSLKQLFDRGQVERYSEDFEYDWKITDDGVVLARLIGESTYITPQRSQEVLTHAQHG